MAYLVLARKYRPESFDSVVHQDHVTTTLKNAIKLNRVSHAHIFTGPRGTGKTTIARILAKSLNCHEGPTINPCGKCISCMEAGSASSADIIEIDGASNNNVEQIREIRDNLQYMPVNSRFKIYIIDEVHMLSMGAFNALLKSLEEPPSHVIFMFATTEPHKVPVTIMSRCQRHDLKKVPSDLLVSHLREISSREEIKITDPALFKIAFAGEGSVRDSMSVLDQVISSSPEGEEIDENHVNWLLGVSPFSVVNKIFQSIFLKNELGIVEAINEISTSGLDLKVFYRTITDYFKHLIFLKLEGENGKLCILPENEKKELLNISESVSLDHIVNLFDIVMKEELSVKNTEYPDIIIELLFLKLARIPVSKKLEEILEEIKKLESKGVSLSAAHAQPGRDETVENPGKNIHERSMGRDYIPSNDFSDKRPSTEISENRFNPSLEKRASSEIPEAEKGEDEIAVKDEKLSLAGMSDAEKWGRVVSIIQKEKPSVGNIIKSHAKFLNMEKSSLSLEISGSAYYISKFENKDTISLIEKTASDVFGDEIKIELENVVRTKKGGVNEMEERDRLLLNAENNLLVSAIKEHLQAKVTEKRIIKKRSDNKKVSEQNIDGKEISEQDKED